MIYVPVFWQTNHLKDEAENIKAYIQSQLDKITEDISLFSQGCVDAGKKLTELQCSSLLHMHPTEALPKLIKVSSEIVKSIHHILPGEIIREERQAITLPRGEILAVLAEVSSFQRFQQRNISGSSIVRD